VGLLTGLVLGVGPVLAQTCVKPPAGLIAWWTGDTDFSDRIGHSNGVPVDHPHAGVPGLVGGAFELDGIDESIITPLTLPRRGTIELWVQATPLLLNDIHGIIGTFGLNNGNDRLWVNARGPAGGLNVDPNKFVINIGDCCTTEIIAESRLILGTWAHIAVTFDFDSDVFALYINGVLQGLSSEKRTAPTRELRIGVNASDFGQTFYFPGLLDEVSVYNRPLTANEIRAIFRAGSAGKCKERR
jgi:hypothetical protein